MIGFADALTDLNPDLMLVLGDRYEIFAAAASAMIACIPIAHLQGGELLRDLLTNLYAIVSLKCLIYISLQQKSTANVIQLGKP